MSRFEKLLQKILSGTSDKNVGFEELCNLLASVGLDKRIKGGHHIFTMKGVDEIINLQPLGDKAKSYQVKQVRAIILKYKLDSKHEQ